VKGIRRGEREKPGKKGFAAASMALHAWNPSCCNYW